MRAPSLAGVLRVVRPGRAPDAALGRKLVAYRDVRLSSPRLATGLSAPGLWTLALPPPLYLLLSAGPLCRPTGPCESVGLLALPAAPSLPGTAKQCRVYAKWLTRCGATKAWSGIGADRTGCNGVLPRSGEGET